MSAANQTRTGAMQDELVLTRTFKAPRDLVFKAFAEPERLAQWWGAKGFTTRVVSADVRPGGELFYAQAMPNGKEMFAKFIYREVAPPERLVFVSVSSDAEGNIVPNPWVPTLPSEILNTLTLTETQGVTTLEMRGQPINATEEGRATFAGMHSGLRGGFGSTFDRLEEYLASVAAPDTKDTLVIVRDFDAPRALVWDVWTRPEHLVRWWGPEHFTAPVCKSDFRVGGRYHYCMRDPEGHDYWSTGVFREIVPTERIVATDCFADADGNVVPSTYYGLGAEHPLEVLVITTFADLGNGRTRLTLEHVGVPAGEFQTGAESGWNTSFDKLAAVLADLQA